MNKVRKILIMELWGIGDVVMMSSVLKPLRDAYPDAEISVIVQKYGRELLKENKEIRRFFVFKFPWTSFSGKYAFWRWDWRGLGRILKALRREKFDLVLDARGDLRNNLFASLLGVRYTLSLSRRDLHRHRMAHWADVLHAAKARYDEHRPSIHITSQERAGAKKFLEQKFPARPRMIVGIHPGAAQKVRCWPISRFKEVGLRLKDLGVGVLIFLESDGYGRELAQGLEAPSLRGGVRDLAMVVEQLHCLICNDSGPMHVASGVGAPVIAVFGSGQPTHIGPCGEAQVVIKPCSFRPCFDRCRKASNECLEAISVDDVWDKVLKMKNVARDRS